MTSITIRVYVVFCLLVICRSTLATEDILRRNGVLGPCQACKVFVESFDKGLQRIGHLPRGEGSLRLAEIQADMCEEPSTRTNCLEVATLATPFIEEWWIHPNKSLDMYTYICIDKLEVCCPKHHYGKECSPCVGDLENLCNGHGKCRGDSTRKGIGTCLCDPGYTGELCDECVTGFYKDPNRFVCKRCHYACLGGCRAATHKDCVACKPGFAFDSDEGCLDINECNNIDICTKDEFCLNSIGSYKCMACDKACRGCYGDGPDMCRKCAQGYLKKGDMCIKEREDEEMDQMTVTRYMTYFGLLFAAGVLLPKSVPMGASVGALVLAYIVGAEYYCALNGYKSLLDLSMFTI